MATASVPPSYSHDHYQSLPTLETARKNYLEAGGDSLIKAFEKFFIDHKMDETFGLCMNHRHFDIAANQKLVGYNGISTGWDYFPDPSHVKASMWAYDGDGVLKETEFEYTKEKDHVAFGKHELNFVKSLQEMLKQLGVERLFGLARYPGDSFAGSCEITQGKTNINLEPKDYPDDLVHIPTVWWFSEDLRKRGCRCTCNASAPSHPHGSHVITVQA